MKPLRGRPLLWAGAGAVLCGALVAWSLAGSAGPSATAVPVGPVVPLQTDLWRASLRTGAGLAVIVVLILGVAAVARRYGLAPARRTAGALEVVDRLDLAPKRALYSVRAGGRVVLVGVTESSITPVLEWGADESAGLYPPGAGTQAPAFASFLYGAVAKAKKA